MTNSTCLRAWNHNMARTPAGYAYTEGEHRRPRNPMQPLTLQKMMTDSRIPVANIPVRVKLSRSLLIISLCAILATFGSQNTDAPAQRHSPVVRTGNKTTRDTAVRPAGRSFHRQSSVFLGVEAADAHSEKERQSYVAASREGNNGWENRPGVHGGRHIPHSYDEDRSVPSHLIMRAAIEEALSALEDRSHRGAATKHVEHSPSTTHEPEKHLLSYGNVAHGPTEGNTHVGVYSGGGIVGDDALERGSHDSHEQWTEEHAETNEDVEHTEVPADRTHPVRRRHRVYDGSKSKTPAEVFNQDDSLLTVIDGPDSPEKGVSVGSDVLEAVAEPIMPSHEAEVGAERTGALQRGESRLLGLQPITVILTAVLVAVALMLAHSQSDAGKHFFQHTLLPGRRQESREYVSHPMVNDRAEHRYFEDGYIADPGEDGAGQQADWMQREDETTGAPFDNDFRIREIEQGAIRLDADKDERLKNSTMASLQTSAYRAEQAESTEGLREPFTVPAGAAETLYKDKSEYRNFADNSSNGPLETEGSEDDEVGGHHG